MPKAGYCIFFVYFILMLQEKNQAHKTKAYN